MIPEEKVESFISKYVKDSQVVSIGTSKLGEHFLKKLALKIESEKLKVQLVPTSTNFAAIAASFHVPTVSLNEKEIDVAFEFASQADKQFNFIKGDSLSLVRDKMIAQSAAELMIIVEKENVVEKLHGLIPFEITSFGWKRSEMQLQNLGKAKIREKNGKTFKTETGHYIVDVQVDEIFDLDELEFQAKNIPGVLETGLFIGYADRIVTHNDKIEVKSRMGFE